jgi:ABC-2 type transport system permease protein
MWRVVRSELVRLRRRTFVLGWLGLTTLSSVVLTSFAYLATEQAPEVAEAAPGGGFPSAEVLASSDGLTAALGSTATLLGVVTLAFWAIAMASDFSTGLVRLLTQAEPRRVRLLLGKVGALVLWTAMAAALATTASVAVSPALAAGANISTDAWGDEGAALGIAQAALQLFSSLLVWGVIGLVVAVLSRSAAVAVSAGVAYVLVIETLVGTVAEDAADWLPGATLRALATGGDAVIDHGTALALGAGYALAGLALAAIVLVRRDVSD